MVRRSGFTLVEVLAVVAILGILLSLLAPAISAARNAARKVHCTNNMLQLGLALADYRSSKGHFPAGRDSRLGFDHSWMTAILPQIGRSDIYDKYNYEHKWNDPADNGALTSIDVPHFVCPATAGSHDPGATDYGGCYGSSLSGLEKGFSLGKAWDAGVLVVLGEPSTQPKRTRPIDLADIRDGASNTFLVLEDAGRVGWQGGRWGNGHQGFAHDWGKINTNRSNEIFSDHVGGANVLMADGSVRFQSDETLPSLIGALSTRDRGESLNDYLLEDSDI